MECETQTLQSELILLSNWRTGLPILGQAYAAWCKEFGYGIFDMSSSFAQYRRAGHWQELRGRLVSRCIWVFGSAVHSSSIVLCLIPWAVAINLNDSHRGFRAGWRMHFRVHVCWHWGSIMIFSLILQNLLLFLDSDFLTRKPFDICLKLIFLITFGINYQFHVFYNFALL